MKKLSLWLFLFVCLAGCKDNNDDKQTQIENNLKQGWKLSSMQKNGIDVDISGIPLPELMYFTEQSVCYLATPENNQGNWTYKDVRTAWNYDSSNQILNIAARLPITYYVGTITNNQLTLYYNAFNSTGGIDAYETTYQPVDVEVKDLKVRVKN